MRTNDIAIYGAGGLGREVAWLIEEINMANKETWNFLGFFDDGKRVGEKVDDYPVLGGLDALNSNQGKLNVVVAVADTEVRKRIVDSITNPSIYFPSLIHPTVNVGSPKHNSIGKGCIISAGTILTTNIKISNHVIVNLSCLIGHDVTIDSYSSLMPGCRISGFVTIEEGVFIGTSASILPKLRIGRQAIVGAGAVVTRDVSRGKVVVGIPAKESFTS